jgi:hypothetical protein
MDYRRAKKRDELHPAKSEEMAEGQAHNQMLSYLIIGNCVKRQEQIPSLESRCRGLAYD